MQQGSVLECIKTGKWVNQLLGPHNDGPKYKDIVTHDGVNPIDSNYIYLLEYSERYGERQVRKSYNKSKFRELHSPSEKIKL